jgi:hypothetical protein
VIGMADDDPLVALDSRQNEKKRDIGDIAEVRQHLRAAQTMVQDQSVSVHPALHRGPAVALVLMAVLPGLALGQISPEQANQIRNAIGDRIEALTILVGDYGLAGGSFRSTGQFQFGERTHATLGLTKLGGAGEKGDPQPLGNPNVRWQPRLEGNMGSLQTEDHLQSPLVEGDVSKLSGYALEFGGGARYWFSKGFSVAPVITAIYGHMSSNYTAVSPFMKANLPRAIQEGLVGWRLDTWTAVGSLNLQYIFTWKRAIVTLSSEPDFFHTETGRSSNPHARASGDASAWANKIDVDAPLGILLWGHELHSGGYFTRTDLGGALERGLNVSYIYEAHGRVTLDFLNKLWKVQWLGIGGSYLWGPNIRGWTAGADVKFKF